MPVTSRVEKWTPKKAEDQLTRNPNIRNLKEYWAIEIAAAMAAGEFQLNGETVVIDENGNLADGQHRLRAIVISGIPVDIVTVRGIVAERKVVNTIDGGKIRTTGEILGGGLHHEKNANTLAAALRLLWAYENGKLKEGFYRRQSRRAQQFATLEKHPGIRDSVQAVESCHQIISRSIAAFGHYVFSRQNPSRASSFFECLIDGVGLSKETGVYLFRERMIANRSGKAKLRTIDVIALMFKAWIYHRDARRVRCLKWANTEEFPSIE